MTKWNITADLKDLADGVFEKIKIHLLECMGINIQFEMAGNACSKILSEDNHAHVLDMLETDDEKKVPVNKLFKKLL